MGQAFKCDRCGQIGKYGNRITRARRNIIADKGLIVFREWELCTDCWQSFKNWIDNPEGENNEETTA